MQTKGQVALAQKVEEFEGGQSGIARAVGLDPSSISQIARGVSRPKPLHRKAFEIVLGIPEDDWLTEEEIATLERIRASTTNGDAAA
jgi:transcriptional regulator with XRE-family HTH domain